jgi:HD-like signal output (HDOD) protein
MIPAFKSPKNIMTNVAASAVTVDDPIDQLMRSIRIPPRPSLLIDLQRELAQPTPSPRSIAKIITNDVGMAGALLKLANSPFYGAARKATSVEQGINFLGINKCTALVTGLLARRALDAQGESLIGFWEISAQRAQALVFMAGKLHVAPPDIAHTFGLFCDIGVPLLMNRFPDYSNTLAEASGDARASLTALEDARHNTNHAAIGCLLARNWGLSGEVSWAILLHHDYQMLEDTSTDESIRSLVALSLLAEKAIQHYHGNASLEWDKGGESACRHLGLSREDTEDLLDELQAMLEVNH